MRRYGILTGKGNVMNLQQRYNETKEQNAILVNEIKRYELEIKTLKEKIINLSNLNQKAFEVNLSLSHEILCYQMLTKVNRMNTL